MRLLIDIIVGLLWLLIKIGDTVFFAGEFVGRNVKRISKNIKKIKPPRLRFSLPEIKLPHFRITFPKHKRRKSLCY